MSRYINRAVRVIFNRSCPISEYMYQYRKEIKLRADVPIVLLG